MPNVWKNTEIHFKRFTEAKMEKIRNIVFRLNQAFMWNMSQEVSEFSFKNELAGKGTSTLCTINWNSIVTCLEIEKYDGWLYCREAVKTAENVEFRCIPTEETNAVLKVAQTVVLALSIYKKT
jgi:hypothetical protein